MTTRTHDNPTPDSPTSDTRTTAERRYEKNLERTETSLPTWRTAARRRLLVRLNWASLSIMAAIAVAGYFWFPIILAWLPMTVVICTVWTMLRVTIDSKDTAPARYLDEFETATLLQARSRALNLVTSGTVRDLARPDLRLEPAARGGPPSGLHDGRARHHPVPRRGGHPRRRDGPHNERRRGDRSGLAVMSREVGQSGVRCLASEGGVGSMMIGEVQPTR